MKPRRTPCSFSKRSWYFLRSSITGAMPTSLNVVRIAAVCCDCTRRSATRWRRRDIGTRCSGRPESNASILTGGGNFCRLLEHVALGDPSVAARAKDLRGVDALLRRDFLGSRHHRGSGPRFFRRRFFVGRRSCCCLRLGIDLRDDVARGHRVAALLQDLDEHAVGGCRQLEHHLVGLDVDEVLIARDRLAFLLVPVEQRRLGDRLRQLRHFHFDDHDCSRSVFPRVPLSIPRVGEKPASNSPGCACYLNLPKACSTSAFCASLCRAM